MKTKYKNLISYLLVLEGAIIYISLVFNNNVWLDEAFTASLVRTDMAGVLQRSMQDTLPPLYNILLKLTTDIFGYEIFVMKLTSVVPMILTMVLSATVFRKRHGYLASYIFTIALFTMPNLLFYGVEIRMYSLGFFFATASAIYCYEVIAESNIKNWILFTVFSVLAGYSHHFAFVTVGFVYLFLLLYYILCERENIKRWFICLAATIVLYFPCLVVTLKQLKSVSGYFSMPDVTFIVFIKYALFPFIVGNKALSVLLGLTVLALFAYTVFSYKTMAKVYGLYMFFAFYGVLVFGTIVSKIMTANIFVDRYLFFAIGLIWIFVSLAVCRLDTRVYVSTVILLLICGLVGYAKEYRIEYSHSADAVIDFLDENVGENDTLYTIEDHEEMAFCLPFYDERLTNYENLSEAVIKAQEENGDVWLSVINYSEYDFEELKEYDLEAEFEGTFSFDRYTFDMYKLKPAS